MAPRETRSAILGLLDQRQPGASICPSEAARKLDPERWREQMEQVRAVARQLAREGTIEITQRGNRLPPDARIRGPVRLRLAPGNGQENTT